MKAMPWFRMYTEAIDDEKLRLLAFESGSNPTASGASRDCSE